MQYTDVKEIEVAFVETNCDNYFRAVIGWNKFHGFTRRSMFCTATVNPQIGTHQALISTALLKGWRNAGSTYAWPNSHTLGAHMQQ